MKATGLLICILLVSCSANRADTELGLVNQLRERIEIDPSDAEAIDELLLMAAPNSGHIIISRVNALAALGEVSIFVPEEVRATILDVLVANSQDSSAAVRRASYRAMSKNSWTDEIPSDVIVAGLRERNSDVASFAADIAQHSNRIQSVVLLELLEIIESSQKKKVLETTSAIRALAVMESPPVVVNEVLIGALRADDREVVCEAARALAQLQRDYEFWPATLEKLLAENDFSVRLCAIEVLALLLSQHYDANYVEMVRNCTSDSNPAVRMRSKQVLDEFSFGVRN